MHEYLPIFLHVVVLPDDQQQAGEEMGLHDARRTFLTRTFDLLPTDNGMNRIQEQQKYLDTTTDKVCTRAHAVNDVMLK